MPPKYQLVAESLRAEIEEGIYCERMLLPTEQLLCQRFHISRQTARRALSLLEEEGWIARRQGSGSHLLACVKPEKTLHRSIAVVTTYISDYIFPSILREIETVLSASSCAPLVFATQNQISIERKVLLTLLSMKELDGVLVEGTKTALPNPNLDLYRRLIARGVNLVFINGVYPELSDTLSVLDDNRGGGRLLTQYLCRKGHRNILGIFKSDDMQGLLRYAGYVETLRDLDLPLEDSRVFWYNTENKQAVLSDLSLDAIWEAARDCTATICYNDEVAVRLVTHLLKRGIHVPEQMAVVSFDNSQYSELSPLRITSLSHDKRNVGRLAAELMLRLLQGEPCQSETAPWILLEKESS